MDDEVAWNGLASEAIARGTSIDDVLAILRRAGAGPVHSMKVLCDTTGLGLGEAKKVVWLSPVWADQLPGHQRLETDAIAALEEVEHQDRG